MKPFRPVKGRKISERIAQQIKSAILNGMMKPGDRLPPERELVQRFQAARISVREALKGLEASGLLTIKPGSGVFVAEANSKPMSESLSSILRMQKTSINELTEARIILEPSIAKLASERMTTEDLMKLEQNIQESSRRIKSNCSSRIKNIEFHSHIAESTRNSVLSLTMKTWFDVLKELSSEVLENSPKNVEISKAAVSYHRKVLKAFREKKPKKIYELMQKHILQNQESLRKVKSKVKFH